jgi:hypothetical protein
MQEKFHTLRLIYARCSLCDARALASERTHYPGQEIESPALPTEWVVIGPWTICPAHEIKLEINGNTIPREALRL